MIGIELSLIGSYYRYVRGCPIVSYEVPLGEELDTLDVLAVDNEAKRVHVCEFVRSLMGAFPSSYEEDEQRLEKRIRRGIKLSHDQFPEMEPVFSIWMPSMEKPGMERFQAVVNKLKEQQLKVELVANNDFNQRMGQLRKAAFDDNVPGLEPAYLLLQILEHGRRDFSARESSHHQRGGGRRYQKGFPCRFSVLDWSPFLDQYIPRSRDMPACKMKIDNLKWRKAKEFREIDCPMYQNQRACNLFKR